MERLKKDAINKAIHIIHRPSKTGEEIKKSVVLKAIIILIVRRDTIYRARDQSRIRESKPRVFKNTLHYKYVLRASSIDT